MNPQHCLDFINHPLADQCHHRVIISRFQFQHLCHVYEDPVSPASTTLPQERTNIVLIYYSIFRLLSDFGD